MQKKNFGIESVLNHNTILCKDFAEDKLYIFFGKGIGFGKKKGDRFSWDDKVENSMLVMYEEEAAQYQELLKMVKNDKLVDIVQDIIHDANVFFNNKINANLNLTLLDHLNFALERQKNNIVMNYPFLNEIQFIYPKEYEFSKTALEKINQALEGEDSFDDAELGFLVLHIHAAVQNEKVSTVLLNNQMLYECTEIIERELQTTIDRQSIYYSRFSKHLEYAVSRNKNGIHLENVMTETIKEKCAKEYNIAIQMNNHLKDKYRVDLTEDELGYLAIHLSNLRN